jgi:hypothetical protein
MAFKRGRILGGIPGVKGLGRAGSAADDQVPAIDQGVEQKTEDQTNHLDISRGGYGVCFGWVADFVGCAVFKRWTCAVLPGTYKLLKIIQPNNDFKGQVIGLMGPCPLVHEKEMRFPAAWKEESLWE